jgi:hypothetical protein
MNDRELLELAAKAAGINLNSVYGCDIPRNFSEPDHPIWNPLTDDGDALRLAVKCNLNIEFEAGENGGIDVDVLGRWDDAPSGSSENFEHDGYEATRRAIVRAAASIGAQMP